jgi:hypothetical protein
MRSEQPLKSDYRVIFDSSNDERLKIVLDMDAMANRMMSDPVLAQTLKPEYQGLRRKLVKAGEDHRLNRKLNN